MNMASATRSSEIVDVRYKVYLNLIEMLKFRGYNDIPEAQSADKLLPNLQFEGYTTLSAIAKPSKNHPEGGMVMTALIDIDSPHVDNASHFEKFMKMITRSVKADTASSKLIKLLLVTRELLGNNITNKFSDYSWEIFNYPYKLFTSNRMKHISIPKARIISNEELKKNVLYVQLRELPRIKVSDPVAVWLGAEPGNIIEEISVSEIAGAEIKYRLTSR